MTRCAENNPGFVRYRGPTVPGARLEFRIAPRGQIADESKANSAEFLINNLQLQNF